MLLIKILKQSVSIRRTKFNSVEVLTPLFIKMIRNHGGERNMVVWILGSKDISQKMEL